jgi:DNA invertase Pin-like site-specific DNA recombinase
MRRSTSIAVLLVALLCCAVPWATAQDQPRELWEEFPLDSDRSSPPPRDGEESPSTQAQEGAGDSQPPILDDTERVAEPTDDGLPLWLLPLLGLLAFVGGVFAAKAVLGLMKRRRESGRRRAPPRVEPAPGHPQPARAERPARVSAQAAPAPATLGPAAPVPEPTRAEQPAQSGAEPAPTQVSAPEPPPPKEPSEVEKPAPPKDKRPAPKIEEPVAAAPPAAGVKSADTEQPRPKAPKPMPSEPPAPKPKAPRPEAPKPQAPKTVEAERPAAERVEEPVPLEAKRPEPKVEEPKVEEPKVVAPKPQAAPPRRAEPADTQLASPKAPEPQAPKPEPPKREAPKPEPAEPKAPEPQAPRPATPSPAKAKRPGPEPAPSEPQQPTGPEGLPEDVIPFPSARPPRPGRRLTRPAAQRALGYVSAADAEGQTGDLEAQTEQIRAACVRNGFESVEVVRDFESHSGSDLERPGLVYAIEKLEAGEASCLVVASLERLTRSAAHLGTLIDRLSASGIRLVVLDIQLDTGNPDGRLAAEALASVGTLERRNLDIRTRKGLQAAREGRRSGRPAVADRPALKERIAEMRARGMTLQAIADTLNTEGVPTLRGGTEWRPSSVQAAVGYKRPKRGAGKTDRDTVDSNSGGESNGGSAGSMPRGGS